MISGEVFTLFEGQSISSVSRIKHAIHQNTVDVEIGFHVIFREMELLLFHLRRIIHAVVGLQLKIVAHSLARIGFNLARLLLCLGQISGSELLQESLHILRRFGHRFLQRIGCIVGITHESCFFGT